MFRRSKERILVVCVLLLGVALALHCRYYWPFLSDDALISLRYAERLTQGAGLTWTDGDRVEGYTDLLWVLLAAAARTLGFDTIQSARFLDFVGAYAAVIVVGFEPRSLRLSLPRLIVAGTLLALSAPLAVWAIGALEHGFMAGVLAVALISFLRIIEQQHPRTRRLVGVGIPFAVLALLRADGVVLLVAALAGLMLGGLPGKERRRLCLWIALPSLAALLTQLGFRRFYYGQLVPNTALVKVSFNLDRLALGFTHLRQGFSPLLVLLGLATLATMLARKSVPRSRLLTLWTTLAGWAGYVMLVGGDIFPGWRQLLFTLIPMAILIGEGAKELTRRWPKYAWTVAVGLVPLGYSHWRLQVRDPENRRAKAERWEWDGYSVGDLLRRGFGTLRPLLAVDAAGALPYWSGLPSLDMLGLNDAYLPQHPPPGFGRMGIGHELGDGAYIMRRGPDIIAFNNAAGSRTPLFIGGRELAGMEDFQRLYQLVIAQGRRGNQAVAELYMKREGSAVGIRRSANQVEIPAYLLANEPGTAPAHLNKQDQLVVEIVGHYPRKLAALELQPGVWRVTVDPPAPNLALAFRCPEHSANRVRPEGPWSLGIPAKQPISIVIGLERPGPLSAELRTVVLTRDSRSEPTYTCRPVSGRLQVSLGAVAQSAHENAVWEDPHHVVFGWAGLLVSFGELRHASRIELSLDNNDSYEVSAYREDQKVWQTELRPRDNGGGMLVHQFAMPEAVQSSGMERLEIQPTAGDGRFSLGHLRLEP